MKAIFNVYGFDMETRINQWGILRQNPWPSNPLEEWTGYTWAYYENHECTQGGPQNQFDFSDYACITDVLSRFHTVRTLDHEGKLIHSESRIVKVCNKMPDGLPGNNCMILDIPAMHKNYGMWNPMYKQVTCRFLGDPSNEDGETQDILQSNYRTSSTAPAGDADNEFSVFNYWVGVKTDGVLAEFYDHTFNGTETNISWADEVWQLWPGVRGAPDISFCGPTVPLSTIQQHLMSVAPPITGAQPIHLQLFDLRYILPSNWTTQPVYWMDLYGNPAPAGECSDDIGPTPLCVPWQRWGPFVWQLAALNYGADERGDCDTAPCFIQELNGVELIFPPDDGQPGMVH